MTRITILLLLTTLSAGAVPVTNYFVDEDGIGATFPYTITPVSSPTVQSNSFVTTKTKTYLVRDGVLSNDLFPGSYTFDLGPWGGKQSVVVGTNVTTTLALNDIITNLPTFNVLAYLPSIPLTLLDGGGTNFANAVDSVHFATTNLVVAGTVRATRFESPTDGALAAIDNGVFSGDGSGLTNLTVGAGSSNITDNGWVATVRNVTVSTNLVVGGTITGDGGNVTNLTGTSVVGRLNGVAMDATNLTSGVLPKGRLAAIDGNSNNVLSLDPNTNRVWVSALAVAVQNAATTSNSVGGVILTNSAVYVPGSLTAGVVQVGGFSNVTSGTTLQMQYKGSATPTIQVVGSDRSSALLGPASGNDWAMTGDLYIYAGSARTAQGKLTAASGVFTNVSSSTITSATITATNGFIVNSNAWVTPPTLVEGQVWYTSSNGIPATVYKLGGTLKTNLYP